MDGLLSPVFTTFQGELKVGDTVELPALRLQRKVHPHALCWQ
jgi:hypothetical protein